MFLAISSPHADNALHKALSSSDKAGFVLNQFLKACIVLIPKGGRFGGQLQPAILRSCLMRSIPGGDFAFREIKHKTLLEKNRERRDKS